MTFRKLSNKLKSWSKLVHMFLKQKGISLGEIHGIVDLVEVKLHLIQSWLKNNQSIVLFLERSIDQQDPIQKWMDAGQPEPLFKRRFLSPSKSSFLEDQYIFLNQLSQLYRLYHPLLQVFCIDFNSEDPSDRRSNEILKSTSEDEFDVLREQFIIDQMKCRNHALESTERILWICGNMHASKTNNYFSLKEEPCQHIETSAMWLNALYGLESVFSLPFAGEFNYQQNGKLQTNNFTLNSSIFLNVLKDPFLGLQASHSLPIPSREFIDSYDWVFGLPKTHASKSMD